MKAIINDERCLREIPMFLEDPDSVAELNHSKCKLQDAEEEVRKYIQQLVDMQRRAEKTETEVKVLREGKNADQGDIKG